MTNRILIVEDEPEMQVVLQDNLQYEGYGVLCAGTGEEGITVALCEEPSLVLLDLMLPMMSGYEVCRRLRSEGFQRPIIMISARNAQLDCIAGFELGADDYIAKPFNIRELLARVRAQLRHSAAPRQAEGAEFAFGDCLVDLKRRTVTRGAQHVPLSSRECDLLLYFIAHRGEVIPRDRLLSDVWGFSAGTLTRSADNFVAKLRRKLEPGARVPRHILTVHGTGYRFIE